ncbi:hypothetical protein QUH73_20720, partial [Labilibaculum sp. K2S]|uniref:hypothetical protein n=1 Tax=Labilibaculum sp. K2S TaxID=3056386 RepID=UPI0025A46B77
TGSPLGDANPNDPNGDGNTSDATTGKAGDIKYNTTTKTLWFHDGAQWNPINTDKQLFSEILTTDNDAGAKQIKNLLDPTDDKDAATKIYVDGQLSSKVDKVAGKVLTSNDYADADKAIVADAEKKSNKNSAGGYAGLDANKKIDESQLPKIVLGNVYGVNSEAEQLALAAVSGDVAVRSDENKSYVHNGGTTATIADWTELKTPTGEVFSVNGKKGDVVINAADIADLQTAINSMVDLSTVYTKSESNNLLDAKIDKPTGINDKILITDGSGNLVWANQNSFSNTDNQNLSLTGTNLSIANGNTVDLSGINSDNQLLTKLGSTISLEDGGSVVLNDDDAGNEIQVLSLSGSSLSISNGNNVDLSNVSSDDQNLGEVLTQGNDAGAKQIKNLLDPTDDQDAATKVYVDDAVTAGAPNASTTVKGIVQLAGDLAGTAALPVIAADAVTSAKILDGTIAV